MGKTVFGGPLQVGTVKEGASANVGKVVLSKSVVFTIAANIASVTDADGQTSSQYNGISATVFAAATVAASATVTLPANSQITDIIIDVPTAITGPTASNLTVGTAAAGAQYVTSTDLQTGPVVRVRPTFTNAQLLAMMNVTTNTSVVATLTGTVANFTAGAVVVTVEYVQN